MWSFGRHLGLLPGASIVICKPWAQFSVFCGSCPSPSWPYVRNSDRSGGLGSGEWTFPAWKAQSAAKARQQFVGVEMNIEHAKRDYRRAPYVSCDMWRGWVYFAVKLGYLGFGVKFWVIVW